MITAVLAALVAVVPSPSPTPSASPLPTIGTVVTTADRYTEPLAKAAQTTYVVTQAQIEAEGDQTIAAAIRFVPGVTLFQYGAFGSQTTFGTLGTVGAPMIVLLNGTPIMAGSTGEVDLGTLSTNDVERIEIVESGGSTLYGSGGAGGVVNIITAVPNATYLSVSDGSFGDRDLRAAVGNGMLGVSFERHLANNDYPYPAQGGLPAGVRQNAEASQADGAIDYQQSLGPYTLSATARFSALAIGLPGPAVAGELTASAYDPSNRNDLYAKIERGDGKFTTSLSVAGFHLGLFDNNDGAGPEDAIVDARTNGSLEVVDRESPTQTLVAGADLSRESVLDILGAFGPPPAFSAAQSQSALYLQQSIGIGPNGKTYVGVRGENDTPAGATLEPAAGLQLPVGALRIAANVASSFIVPTLVDLYYPNFSNPSLLPERDRNLNLVLSSDTSALRPRLTLFDRTSSDLITFNANFVPVNAGMAHFQGAVLSIAPVIGRTLVQLSVTDLPTANEVNSGVVSRADYEPVLQGTASIERLPGSSGLGYGVDAKIVGAHTESYLGPGLFGQYAVYDAYVRARLAPHALLTARVFDAGNAYYQTFATYPMPARSFRLELATR